MPETLWYGVASIASVKEFISNRGLYCGCVKDALAKGQDLEASLQQYNEELAGFNLETQKFADRGIPPVAGNPESAAGDITGDELRSAGITNPQALAMYYLKRDWRPDSPCAYLHKAFRVHVPLISWEEYDPRDRAAALALFGFTTARLKTITIPVADYHAMLVPFKVPLEALVVCKTNNAEVKALIEGLRTVIANRKNS